jgi:hypothetical protein
MRDNCRCCQRTAQLAQPRPKLIALFQYALPSSLNECIKFDREICHAPAQVIEIEID